MAEKVGAAAAWAQWLREAMDAAGLKAIDIQNRSGHKENGRPVIDRSRVSQWLNKPERPSFEFVSLVANIVGRPVEEALEAAGYVTRVEIHNHTGVREAFYVIEAEDADELAALEAFRAGYRAHRNTGR